MSYSGKYKAAVITAARKPIELWEYDHIDPGAGCINIAVVRAGNPIRPCHACYECTIERDLTGCRNGTFVSPARNNITWASYTQVATLQQNNNFYRVDPNVPLDAFIALGCALPTMLKGLENMGPITRGSAVLVQGCGAVGLAAIFLAKIAGARAIICIEGNSERQKMAARFGATEILDMSRGKYTTASARSRRIREIVGPQGLELAIECSGHAAAVTEGLSLLGRNARYLLVGTWAGAGTVTLSPFEVVHKALKIIGTTYASPENYYQAARLVEAHFREFPFADCVTHRFPLTHVSEALEMVAGGTAVKVVIEPQEE
ncbi:hypothetical protein E8E15_007749 [Penicillium rubens]|nr:hypothetical protein E8E15_007749 [Penicillium rubens]KAJ5035908.1 hypothetical protein NUH16_003769 [Penicillium rubens]